MIGGTHTFLATERVHFGARSLDKLEEEARSYGRAFVVTGRTLDEKTGLVRRVEGLLGEKHAGTYVGMGEHTPGSAGAGRAGRGAGGREARRDLRRHGRAHAGKRGGGGGGGGRICGSIPSRQRRGRE